MVEELREYAPASKDTPVLQASEIWSIPDDSKSTRDDGAKSSHGFADKLTEDSVPNSLEFSDIYSEMGATASQFDTPKNSLDGLRSTSPEMVEASRDDYSAHELENGLTKPQDESKELAVKPENETESPLFELIKEHLDQAQPGELTKALQWLADEALVDSIKFRRHETGHTGVVGPDGKLVDTNPFMKPANDEFVAPSAEAPSVEAKPVDAQPETGPAQPVDAPASEAKPVDAQPETGPAQPVDAPESEAKPADAQPEAKPGQPVDAPESEVKPAEAQPESKPGQPSDAPAEQAKEATEGDKPNAELEAYKKELAESNFKIQMKKGEGPWQAITRQKSEIQARLGKGETPSEQDAAILKLTETDALRDARRMRDRDFKVLSGPDGRPRDYYKVGETSDRYSQKEMEKMIADKAKELQEKSKR